MNISKSYYKGKESIVLENSLLRAEFLPEPGGKLASLVYKPNGFELLVQKEGDIYQDQSFDGNYIEGECSGYDDMFPTIDECLYMEEPWRDVKMADHGEVWSLPWQSEIFSESLRLTVSGVRFPYELQKIAYFKDENTLRLDYSLSNKSDFRFEFLWAAHIMMNVEGSVQISVPPDCREIVSVLSNSDRPFGEISTWPYLFDGGGRESRLDMVSRHAAGRFEKFYFTREFRDGFCLLDYLLAKMQVKVSFPATTVPYLGLLVNEKGWNRPEWKDLSCIFVEPCTVCYDRPDLAKKYGQISAVGPSSTISWFIDIFINTK